MAPKPLPYNAPELDKVQDDHFAPAISWAIQEAKKDIEHIKTNPDPATFKNTIEALELSGRDLSRIVPVFNCFCASKSNDKLRKIQETVEAELSNFHSDISLDEDLFKRVKTTYDNTDQTKLSSEEKTLLTETYKNFVRNGALLKDEEKKRMREINEKLSCLTTTFDTNVLKATEAYKKLITDENELKGVPARAKSLYQRQAEESGHAKQYLIALEPYPIDIFTHAVNRKLREELYRASATCCYKDKYNNLDIIMELVRLRHEKATLLGYNSYAQFVLEDRMANNVEAVEKLLETNLSIYKPAAEHELEEIKNLALQLDGIKEIKPWDIAYYARILKERTFNLEIESLRPYFNLEKVLIGVTRHVERLFNIELKPASHETYPVYHTDVLVYEILDRTTRNVIGLFYADYYARPGEKRSGAWMSTLRDHSECEGKTSIPIVLNNCNFPKPSPEHPTFLSLGDVETIFHEFGHALHALLAQSKYASLSGPNVKWDFVELPSQVQERWAIQKDVLDTFAVHHETGEKLEDDTIKTILAMKNFDSGLSGLRQTFLALLDMAYYTTSPDTIPNPEELEQTIAARATLVKREAGLMSTAFQHIFSGGYSAGYYSYKWSEVLDADVFCAFLDEGLYNPVLSQKLRTLYAKGGTQAPMEIFKDMMGREPDPSALFKLSGLAVEHR
jgi:peptidyl-dipeptidase Dcp